MAPVKEDSADEVADSNPYEGHLSSNDAFSVVVLTGGCALVCILMFSICHQLSG